jgi:hypothetical protein
MSSCVFSLIQSRYTIRSHAHRIVVIDLYGYKDSVVMWLAYRSTTQPLRPIAEAAAQRHPMQTKGVRRGRAYGQAD